MEKEFNKEETLKRFNHYLDESIEIYNKYSEEPDSLVIEITKLAISSTINGMRQAILVAERNSEVIKNLESKLKNLK